nr:TRAP transporter large permease subunit [Burkholderiaceae bacterium]
AASVISMGLISLPIMLRYGYDRRLATGVIAASGTLAQIIPPSLVLIILADQLGRSVGAMYLGAFIPGLTLTALYLLYVVAIALFRRHHAPALPVQARTLREPSGQSGLRSLAVLAALATVFAYASLQWFTHRHPEAATDTRVMVSLLSASASAWLLALINQTLQLGMISQLAQRVTFVLIPPLALIFLVLGTIFLGWATPTEGGAMGATGALLMALTRRRLSLPLLTQAMDRTMKLSCFVMFILLGATIFNLTFQGIDGGRWVEHLLSDLPGGQIGFLIAVNVLVFVLAFFLDFFELSFIIVPLLVPAAQALNIDLVWLGIILAVNMQTSFMHPPFGFALFYLRSVAPAQSYTDRITGARIAPITTGQIYWGAVPFLCIQILMVALLIRFPSLVTGQLDQAPPIPTETMRLAPIDDDPFSRPLDADPDPTSDEDPVAAMKRAMQEDRGLSDAP